MTVTTPKKATTTSAMKKKALTVLESMFLSRYADEKMGKLVKQNKGATFQLSAAGHELIGAVCGHALTPEKDWAFPYYRDQAFTIALGTTAHELFAAFLVKDVENHSGGRMMPGHFSHKKLRMPPQSSVVGSQFLQGAGRALGAKLDGVDEVTYVSAGDGATSQGDYHEALNFATIHKLPVIFVIQDNEWAISVPLSEQTAGADIATIARGYPGLEVHKIDGTNYVESTETIDAAVSRARAGEGPSLIVAKVPRIEAHSNSDDQRKYRDAEDLEAQQIHDPLTLFPEWLLKEGIATKEEIEILRTQARKAVEDASASAEKEPTPSPESATDHVFKDFKVPNKKLSTVSDEKIVMMDALNHAITEEMDRDKHVVVFGQDVAHGKGGVFGITRGLTEKFGIDRCFNTPLAESTIVGVALGLSCDGKFKPVAEIQFADYVWTGMSQLINEVSSFHYRSNGQWHLPLVLRMPYGGYIQGGPYHSQSIEAFLAHCPGLKVIIPSNASDAKGLLKTAIRDPNPVVFLEHKGLYRQQKFCAREEPTKDFLIPFGKANTLREGDDVTVICYGMMAVMAAKVADKLAQENIFVEVLDLRTIVPLDEDAIIQSVQKTGKALVAHEAWKNCGFGAELAARITEKAFDHLDAPVTRVAAKNAPISYSKVLETSTLPQETDLEAAIRKLAQY